MYVCIHTYIHTYIHTTYIIVLFGIDKLLVSHEQTTAKYLCNMLYPKMSEAGSCVTDFPRCERLPDTINSTSTGYSEMKKKKR